MNSAPTYYDNTDEGEHEALTHPRVNSEQLQ